MFSTRRIRIDKHLYDRLVKTAQAAGYSGVDEFVRHVLEREADRGGGDSGVDDAEAEKQLRGLGYIE
ncbi:MAG: hypothetical protein CMJ18_01435 [Phycisphaeraceae bacterium]|nr:hypothetical protein [Phycisphaeraceae bacterium]